MTLKNISMVRKEIWKFMIRTYGKRVDCVCNFRLFKLHCFMASPGKVSTIKVTVIAEGATHVLFTFYHKQGRGVTIASGGKSKYWIKHNHMHLHTTTTAITTIIMIIVLLLFTTHRRLLRPRPPIH